MQWDLTYNVRPWTVNAERQGGRGGGGIGGKFGRSKLVLEWRSAFYILAKEKKVPHLDRIALDVRQVCRDKRVPDPGAVYPAVKAALDGIVDAKVVDGDDGRYVSYIKMYAPTVGKQDSLTLTIIDWTETDDA